MANKKKDEITIHSSAAEYLTYIAAVVITMTAWKCVMKKKIYG